MFVNIPPVAVKPDGTLVYTTTSAGNTCRFRDGLAVEIWEADTFRVFVGGQFIDGWYTLAQAIASAGRF